MSFNSADEVIATGEPNPPTTTTSAIYVDTENLLSPAGSDDVEFAQDLITYIVANWPDAYPPIELLTLYVPADKSSQWRIWASDLMELRRMPAFDDNGTAEWREPVPTAERNRLRVRGIQHFTRSGSKNSADMAIAVDAFDDLLLSRRTDFVAVLSNDSDFYTLFDKLHEIVSGNGHPVSRIPFLWIVAPNGNNLSPEIKRFLPAQFVWDISGATGYNPSASQDEDEPSGLNEEAINTLIDRMTVGHQYRASELHGMYKALYPSDRLSQIDTAVFGSYLKNSTPMLDDMGVAVTSTSGTSRYARR